MKRRVKPYLGDSYNRATKTTLTKGLGSIMLSDLNSTLAESGADDEITEDEFHGTLRRSGKDTAPGPDKVQYSDIKNMTEEDRTKL